MSQRIRGVLAPVVTPFKADLAPDSQRFIAHCKWLLSQNCGLAVFGTNSEANSLSMEERARLLDQLVAAGVDPSRMMPGTGCCSIMETVKLTKQAVGNGCAGVAPTPCCGIGFLGDSQRSSKPEVRRRKVSLRCAPKPVRRWCRVENQNQL